MEIHIEAKVNQPVPGALVRARMRRVLSRLPVQPVTAHVTFGDVNGPKGGNDVRCGVLVEVPRRPPIRVERLAPTPRLAFDASFDRVVRRLEQYRERWQKSRRY